MAEERKNADGKPELVDRFSEQPWWKRVVIALAGPGANFITGLRRAHRHRRGRRLAARLRRRARARCRRRLARRPGRAGRGHAAPSPSNGAPRDLVPGLPRPRRPRSRARTGSRSTSESRDRRSARRCGSRRRSAAPCSTTCVPPEALADRGQRGRGHGRLLRRAVGRGPRGLDRGHSPSRAGSDLTAIVSQEPGHPARLRRRSAATEIFHVTITPAGAADEGRLAGRPHRHRGAARAHATSMRSTFERGVARRVAAHASRSRRRRSRACSR